MSVNIAAVNQQMLPLVWVTVEPLIKAAIGKSNGELDVDDMRARMQRNEMVLLVIYEEGAITTALTLEKTTFASGKKILNVTTAGGTGLEKWMGLVNTTLDDLARDHECEEIYIVGRAGWVRKLKALGFGVVHTTVSRKVGER